MNNPNAEVANLTLAFWTLSSRLRYLFPLPLASLLFLSFHMAAVIAYFPHSYCLSKIKIKCPFLPHLLLQLLFNFCSSLLSKMSCKRREGLGFCPFTDATQADWASNSHPSTTHAGSMLLLPARGITQIPAKTPTDGWQHLSVWVNNSNPPSRPHFTV